MNLEVLSLATANPPRYATQQEVYEFLMRHFRLRPHQRDLYRRILLEGPITGRYFGLDYDHQAICRMPDELNGRFVKFAVSTAAEAAGKAMMAAGVLPQDIGGCVVNTCTGYVCPGLSSYLAEQLRLRENVSIVDITGMGCGAAIPNLQCAAGLAQASPARPVLSVSVEICSATLFMGKDPDLIISNSIFGDGASAAVVARPGTSGQTKPMLRVLACESLVLPRHREQLRYRSETGLLRNVLGRRVPLLAAKSVHKVTQRLLERLGMSRSQVDWWIIHPGGTAVLEQIGERLGLSQADLRCSYDIFRQYGNMSSPSVMFVLKRVIEQNRPQAGQKAMIASFGAGFTAFAAMAEFV